MLLCECSGHPHRGVGSANSPRPANSTRLGNPYCSAFLGVVQGLFERFGIPGRFSFCPMRPAAFPPFHHSGRQLKAAPNHEKIRRPVRRLSSRHDPAFAAIRVLAAEPPAAGAANRTRSHRRRQGQAPAANGSRGAVRARGREAAEGGQAAA